MAYATSRVNECRRVRPVCARIRGEAFGICARRRPTSPHLAGRGSGASTIVGKEAIREFVAGFAGVPPGRLVIHHQIASGKLVMNERTDYITINGRPVTLPICGVFEIEDGQIKAWREYFDLGPAKAAYGSSTA